MNIGIFQNNSSTLVFQDIGTECIP